MNRRDLLKHSAVIGAAAAATGCVTPQRRGSASSSSMEMDEYLARLDADLAGIDQADVRPALRAQLGPIADDPRLHEALLAHDPLVRKATKTLYLTAAFRDLPEESRSHPAIQERMLAAGPMMTEAILGMRDRLAALTEPQKKELQAQLRTRPELAEAVCRALDVQVDSALIQPERRLRQRMVMSSYAWRMQHQSVAAVVDTHLEKANRAMARYAARGETPVLAPGSGTPVSGEQIGLWMMGIGLAVGGTGLILLFTPLASVGVLATTVGGTVLLIGLLVFLTAAIGRAAGPQNPQSVPPPPQPSAPPI